MKVTLEIGQDSKPIFPEELVESLHLKPGAKVDVDFGTVTAPPPHVFDRERFDAAVKKYSGSMRAQMLADGYASVDEMMEDIRPQW